jgi:type II secretory pathway pseudopilin PulG
MMQPVRTERGMALPAAIFALVVIGALVAGALFAGTQEQRVAENTRRATQSFGVADAGVAEVLRQWNPATRNTRPIYPLDSQRVDSTVTPNGSGSYGGYVYKLNPNLYLIDMTGRDFASSRGVLQGGGARQRLGMITRIRPVDMNIRASLTTMGSVAIKGNSEIDGNDATPTGWTDCSAPDTNVAGVRNNGGSVTAQGNADLFGNPPVSADPGLGSSTFTQFGDVSYDQLAAAANITLPGGTISTAPAVVGTNCNKTLLTNWGDGMNPNAPCGSYFPIIHMTGSTHLNGVQGQGILLIDGDLTVAGSYQFFGIVIVKGKLETAGGGATEAHFYGAVMAQNIDLDIQSVAGKATLQYSKCAITKALQNTSTVAMMRSRGWVQLF